MKGGLSEIPSERKLESAYQLLLHAHKALTIRKLVLFSQWTRFDPRLAEIWVGYLSRKWSSINPLEFRRELLLQPWPSLVGVLFQFSKKLVTPTKEFSMDAFDSWSRLILDGVAKAKNEQFFIGLRPFGGRTAFEDACYSFNEYFKWGYLGRENLIQKKNVGSLSSETRRQILLSLLERSSRIRTDDYWKALDQCVSRRQAERDLESSPLLRARGRTKARYWTKN